MRVQPDETRLAGAAALQSAADAQGDVAVAGDDERERILAQGVVHRGRDGAVDVQHRVQLVRERSLTLHGDDVDLVTAGAQRLRGPGLEVGAGAAPAAHVGAAEVVGDGDERGAHGQASVRRRQALHEVEQLVVPGLADKAVAAVQVQRR